MAGLLAVFILTLSYYILNFTQVTAQLTQNEVKRTMILNNIKEEMNKKSEKRIYRRLFFSVLLDIWAFGL